MKANRKKHAAGQAAESVREAPAPQPEHVAMPQRWLTGACAALVLLVLLVFAQTARFDWLLYDDPLYVTNNPDIAGGLTMAGLRAAFTKGLVLLWIPVTSISYMLGVSIHGQSSAAHHLTNVALHGMNVLLVLWAFRKLTRNDWMALLVAALFAVHPLCVEPVAWISARKDVLSTTFTLIALGGYLHYAGRPSAARLLLVTLAFMLGVASKVAVLTLPAVLLVLDWRPLHRWQPSWIPGRSLVRLIAEKLPMFAFGLFGMVMALYLHSVAANVEATVAPLGVRVMNACYVYAFYVAKFLLPSGLTVHYPYFEQGPPYQLAAGSVLLLAAITTACIWQARRMPLLLVGWLWYGLFLLPSAGITRAASFLMADRYVYVPMLGLSLMAAVLLHAAWQQRRELTRPILAGCAVAIALLSVLAFVQTRHWRSEPALWGHAVAIYPDAPLILSSHGSVQLMEGKQDEALATFEKALPRAGQYGFLIHTNIANVLLAQQKYGDAIPHLKEAIREVPSHREAYLILAQVLQGAAAQNSDANTRAHLEREARIAQLQAAIVSREEIAPLEGGGPDTELADAYGHLATAYFDDGMPRDALYLLALARQADGTNPRFPHIAGRIFQRLGDYNKARECFRAALSIDPEYKAAQDDLAAMDRL